MTNSPVNALTLRHITPYLTKAYSNGKYVMSVVKTHTGDSMGKSEFVDYITECVNSAGGIRPFASELDVNPGIIANVLDGGDSPQLRRKLGIRKTNRTRLCIDCDEELKTQFYEARGDMSSSGFLAELLKDR